MNFLGIDFGNKRIGLSLGDDECFLAVPLGCLQVHSWMQIFQELEEVVQMRHIHQMVVGYPYNMDDSVGQKAQEVDRFIAELQKKIPLPVERVDERLTSESVGDLYHRSGKKRQKLRRKGMIDAAAATIILQEFLDQINFT